MRDLHYFNKTGGNQPYDWRPFAAGGDSVAVWFRVYMNTENAALKNYTPDDAALVVALRGNFGEKQRQGRRRRHRRLGRDRGAAHAREHRRDQAGLPPLLGASSATRPRRRA